MEILNTWLIDKSVGIDVVPLHRIAHRFDAKDDAAVLKDSDGPSGLRDRDGDGSGRFGNLSRRPMPRTESLRQRQPFGGGSQVATGGDGDSVGGNHERAVDLSEFLDTLTNARIADGSFGLRVAAERVMHLFLRHFHHFAMVPDDEQSPHRLAFASLAADITGQIDDDAKRFERNFGLQPLKISRRQFRELLSQLDDTDRVTAVFLIGGIHDNNRITRLKQFVRDGLQQHLRHLKMPSLRLLLDLNDVHIVLFSGVLDFLAVGCHDQAKLRAVSLQHSKIDDLLGQQNDGRSLDLFSESSGGFQDLFKVGTNLLSCHTRSVRRNLNRSTDEFYAFLNSPPAKSQCDGMACSDPACFCLFATNTSALRDVDAFLQSRPLKTTDFWAMLRKAVASAVSSLIPKSGASSEVPPDHFERSSLPMTRSMDKIVALCKRRGFIFQNSEIYGGQNGFWDYGPLGTELKRNVRDVWYHDMVSAHNELLQPAGAPATYQMVGLESALIMHPQVWKCSGHYDLFHDMMVDCTETRKRYRLDHVKGHWVKCNGKSVKLKAGADGAVDEIERVFITTTEANPIEHVKERAMKIFDIRAKDAERLQIEESTLPLSSIVGTDKAYVFAPDASRREL